MHPVVAAMHDDLSAGVALARMNASPLGDVVRTSIAMLLVPLVTEPSALDPSHRVGGR